MCMAAAGRESESSCMSIFDRKENSKIIDLYLQVP